MTIHLSPSQRKVLKKVGESGATSAAHGLSKMLGRKINVEVPEVKFIDYRNVPASLGGGESIVAAIYFHVLGALSGSVVLVFPFKEALQLARWLVGGRKEKRLNRLAQSALKELGNITAGSYLTALSEIGRMRLIHSVPGFTLDMLQASLDGILALEAFKAEQLIVLRAEFMADKRRIQGHLLFLPDPQGLSSLLRALSPPRKSRSQPAQSLLSTRGREI